MPLKPQGCSESDLTDQVYVVVLGEDNIAFKTDIEAYEYDIYHNPELHSTKELSYERFDSYVPLKYTDLTDNQKEYISLL